MGKRGRYTSTSDIHNFAYGTIWGLTTQEVAGKLLIFMITGSNVKTDKFQVIEPENTFNLIVLPYILSSNTFESPVLIGSFRGRQIIPLNFRVIKDDHDNVYLSIQSNNNFTLNNGISFIVGPFRTVYVICKLDNLYCIEQYVDFITSNSGVSGFENDNSPMNITVMNDTVYFIANYNRFLITPNEQIVTNNRTDNIFYGYWKPNELICDNKPYVQIYRTNSDRPITAGQILAVNQTIVMSVTYTGDLVLSGLSLSNLTNSSNTLVLIKYDSCLNLIDYNKINPKFTIVNNNIINLNMVTDGENVYVAGILLGYYVFGNPNDSILLDSKGETNHFVAKLDNDFDWVWANQVNPNFPAKNNGLINGTSLVLAGDKLTLSSHYWIKAIFDNLSLEGSGDSDLYLADINANNGSFTGVSSIPCNISGNYNFLVNSAGNGKLAIIITKMLNLSSLSVSLLFR